MHTKCVNKFERLMVILMKILAIDSCSTVATCALLVDDTLTAECILNNKNTHSVKLLPLIENMLKSVDTSVTDIDYFACTVGPGSFTGQRIGVSTTKALAHAVGKPVVGVSSLYANAANIAPTNLLICPIMDARRSTVYTATYKWETDNLICISEDSALHITELLKTFNEAVMFLGDGVPAFKEIIKETLGGLAHFAPEHLQNLKGGSVAYCAKELILQGKATTYSLLQPTYLRLSQAERELNEKEKLKI